MGDADGRNAFVTTREKGLEINSRILSIGGTDVEWMHYDKIVQKLRDQKLPTSIEFRLPTLQCSRCKVFCQPDGGQISQCKSDKCNRWVCTKQVCSRKLSNTILKPAWYAVSLVDA